MSSSSPSALPESRTGAPDPIPKPNPSSPVTNVESEIGYGNEEEAKKEDGSRSFTMRELLNDDTRPKDEDTPRSQESIEQFSEQNNAAMELLNSITSADEQGRSRQRVLTYTAKRYASALERNPEDYDALYNWALVLQESADNVTMDSTSPSKLTLLEEACKKYEEATRLCPTLNDAYYNWAIAISDRAKLRGRTKEAEELWKQAIKNYEKAVQLYWNSPQALNNWGLALQELSAIVPAREKQTIVKTAISKYGLAEDMFRAGGSANEKEVSGDELYNQSAIYIAAAHALKPNYSVYASALKLVRSMLPLPFIKVGYLTGPPAGDPLAPHSDWKCSQFVLNHEVLQQINKVEQQHLSPSFTSKSRDSTTSTKATIRVNIPDILSLSSCADLTLPPGAGLCIDTVHGPVYLIADSWEYLDAWLDAIRLVYTIYARGKSDVLAGVIAA